MTQQRPKIVLTRKLPDSVETRMCELFETELNHNDTPFEREELIDAVRTADILVPTVTDRIGPDIIAAAGPRLGLIANFGNGVDNIDVSAATGRRIFVTNTPDVLTEDTADLTIALILAVPRRLSEGMEVMERGEWRGWSPTWMPGRRIWGKRLGIVGFGRIGRAVARRAAAFGMSIHYHNRRRVEATLEAELDLTYWESLDQMLARMDVVSVHCPHTPGTYHLISARRLALMKREAWIVNTARGEVIDEDALAQAIEDGRLAGAGLDVFEHEPAIDPRLARAPNVLLLPHLGSATIEGRRDMGERVIRNIKAFVDGHKPPDRVLPAML